MSYGAMAKNNQFVQELTQFYRARGQINVAPHHLVARLNGQPVSLRDLYSIVLEMGGSFKVNQQSRWDEVYQRLFGTRPSGANVSVALRQIYQRLLMPYEKVHCSNFTSDVVDDDDDDGRTASSRDNANSFVLHSSFLQQYPHHQQQLLAQQQSHGLSCVNPLNKLNCALLSGLPNDMEFGLRITTMLAASPQVDFVADYKFIDVLLDCCKLYSCSCDQMFPPTNEFRHHHHYSSLTASCSTSSSSSVVDEEASPLGNHCNTPLSSFPRQNLVSPPKKCLCLPKFWSKLCNDSSVMGLVFEPSELKCISGAPPSSSSSLSSLLASSPSSPDSQQHQFHDSDTQETMYKKVKRIAEIIRTISYSIETAYSADSNVTAPVSLLKFVALLLSCNDAVYNVIGLDIASNLSTHMATLRENEDEFDALQRQIYQKCVSHIVNSNDTHCLNRSLEVITKLVTTGNDEVTSAVTRLLDEQLYYRLVELLTCQHDISLVVSTLEFCLALSDQRPKLLLQENRILIKILLNLLNCEVTQHFTSAAVAKVTVSDGRGIVTVISTPHANNASSHITVTTQAAPQQLRIVTNQPQQQTVILATTTSQPPALPTNVDNETLAMNWLRATYDVVNGTVKPQPQKLADMYESFVKYNGQIGRKTVVSASQFAMLIKKTFASSNLINNTHVDGISIKSKTVTIVTNSSTQKPGGQLMSPILKAHLSAPPRSGPPLSPGATGSSPNTSTTSTTPATSVTTAATSTLIKSLLASKLRGNAAVTTVAPTSSASEANSTASTLTVPNAIVKTKAENVVASVTTTKATVDLVPKPQPIEVKPQPVKVIVPKVEQTSTAAAAAAASVNTPATTSAVIEIKHAPTPSTAGVTVSAINTITISAPSNTGSAVTAIPMTNAIVGGGQQILLSSSTGTGQPTQQYLLVRTIVGGQGQQSFVGVTPGTGPIRLILPSNLLTQQRAMTVNAANMNGVANHQQTVALPAPVTNVIQPATASTTTTIAPPPAPTSNDILLKAVLGSGITSESSSQPTRSSTLNNPTVKSSPLLNVLLDKGKVPENSNSTPIVASVGNQQVALTTSAVATPTNNQLVSVNSVAPQPKMYILTTKTGVPIRTMQPNTVQQQVQPQPQPQQIITQTAAPAVTVKSEQNVTAAPVVVKISPPNHAVMNGDASLPEIAATKKPSNMNDLSPIKDIQRAVDDATKLISNPKRPHEENDIHAAKKVKPNLATSTATTVVVAPKTVANGDKLPVTITPVTSADTLPIPASNGVMQQTPSSQPSTLPVAQSSATASANSTTFAAPTLPPPSTQPSPPKPLVYACEWNTCRRTFPKPLQVFKHVYDDHVLADKSTPLTTLMACEWGGPEGMGPGCQSKRPKLSLLSHLQDFHCNPNVLHTVAVAVRNQQLGKSGSMHLGLPQPPPAHPGYAQNAAMLAIRRHAVNYGDPAPAIPPITSTTPITVSIRLTAALVLRNLAEHSNYVKSILQSYEPYLSELCVSEGRDESRTIAQCLAVIFEKTGRKS